jgi:hypothetical protein
MAHDVLDRQHDVGVDADELDARATSGSAI